MTNGCLQTNDHKNAMISVILPTYNERENIRCLLPEVSQSCLFYRKQFEIIVVDDNSSDGTAVVVRKLMRENKKIRLVERKERGLGTAVKDGIKAARGDIVLVMDTDFNHSPQIIPRMLQGVEEADVIVGSRYIPGGGMPGRRFRYFFSKTYNIMVKELLGLPSMDNLSGLLAFRKILFNSLPTEKIFIGYGDYHMRFIQSVFLQGWKIMEIPVEYGFRPNGDSKTRLVYHFIRYTQTLFSLFIKPLYPRRP